MAGSDNWRPRLVPADEAYGSGTESLPSFATLHKLEVPPWTATPHVLATELAAVVRHELQPLHDTCRHAGFRPLLSELALISELHPGEGPEHREFSSFVHVFVPEPNCVAQQYLAALTSMEKTGEQIVPHPGLRKVSTAAVVVQPGSASPSSPVASTPRALSIRQEAPLLLAGRQRFKPIDDDDAQFALEDQVATFIDRFLSNLAQHTTCDDAQYHLASSSFILVPFNLPGFASSALVDPDKYGTRPSPGGAFFLFASPDETPLPSPGTLSLDERHLHLVRALGWLMTRAAMAASILSSTADRQALQERFEAHARAARFLFHDLKNITAAWDTRTEHVIKRLRNRRPKDALNAAVALSVITAHARRAASAGAIALRGLKEPDDFGPEGHTFTDVLIESLVTSFVLYYSRFLSRTAPDKLYWPHAGALWPPLVLFSYGDHVIVPAEFYRRLRDKEPNLVPWNEFELALTERTQDISEATGTPLEISRLGTEIPHFLPGARLPADGLQCGLTETFLNAFQHGRPGDFQPVPFVLLLSAILQPEQVAITLDIRNPCTSPDEAVVKAHKGREGTAWVRTLFERLAGHDGRGCSISYSSKPGSYFNFCASVRIVSFESPLDASES